MLGRIAHEERTENALDALRDLSSPRPLVVRDGARTRIAGRNVVRDDPAVKWVVLGALAFLTAVLFVPFLNRLFLFSPLHGWQYALCVVTGAAGLLITEATKLPRLLRERVGRPGAP